MKRRKIIGLALLIGTLVYILAFILSLYQNQRVKMEKGIEEAIKAYAQKDSLDVKQLSKDFNLLLDQKMDTSDLNKQVLKYDGSFARMEKSVTNVTDEMALIEYNVNHLSERMEQIENFYESLYEEIVQKNETYETNITEINNTISEIKGVVEIIKTELAKLESIIRENENIQKEDVSLLQTLLMECEERLLNMEANVLYYRYDSESGTLNVYGNREE